jgi:glycolate oxidase FAD binding subunit
VSILERVRALLGAEAVDLAPVRDGVPRVAPPTADAVALLLGTAHEEGWHLRIEGSGSWMPSDAPADLALTTRRLDRVVAIEPQDLMATVEGGLGFDLLRHQLADRGTWLGLDPPGAQGRTIGSVLATASTGPLRHGFGSVRDHVLGLRVVSGDGRIVESGGRVMKNVAGYDLTKLQVGGFGAFGVIVLVHLRLRALPRADVTAVLEGARDELARVAEDVIAAGLEPAALELVSPALARRERWTLAVRLAGSAALVAAAEVGLRTATGGRVAELRAEEAAAFWRHAAEGLAARAVTLRLGGVASATEELLDLMQHQLGDEWMTATPSTGVLRWAGDATAERLRRVRRALAALEVPLTLERAAWPLRSVVGHFGAYREGVGPLVSELRRTFDPGERFVVACTDDDRGG